MTSCRDTERFGGPTTFFRTEPTFKRTKQFSTRWLVEVVRRRTFRARWASELSRYFLAGSAEKSCDRTKNCAHQQDSCRHQRERHAGAGVRVARSDPGQ